MYQADLARVVASLTLIALAPAPGLAQSPRPENGAVDDTWQIPRLPDGQPDLQGFWTTQTFTPLQRPEYLASQEFYSPEEWAQLQAQLAAEGVDPLAGSAINQENSEARKQTLHQETRDETYVHYDNEIWLSTPVPKGLSSRRTSPITDQRTGRIPPQTESARARATERAARREERERFNGHELRPLAERCIAWTHNGLPILPPAYNDIHRILQTPDYVVVFTALSNHIPRFIPLYDRLALPGKVGCSPGTLEADGKAIHSSWIPATSPIRHAFEARLRIYTSSNALHGQSSTRFATSSPSASRQHGSDPGVPKFR